MDALSRLDLVFCVDLTSSMTPFLDAARAHMARILEGMRAAAGDELRVAIVGYRDHGSIEVVEIRPFTTVTAETEASLRALVVRSPPENSDAAEAVFSGLAACLELPWRDGAYRVIVLVGDAPPHACETRFGPYPDRFEADPSGFDLDGLANRLESDGIFVHALAMFPSISPMYDPMLERAFRRLSISTGGSYHQARDASAAIAIVEATSARFLRELAFDRSLHALLASHDREDVPGLAKALACSEDAVWAGLMRLRQRKLV
jgi:hypothetical protein